MTLKLLLLVLLLPASSARAQAFAPQSVLPGTLRIWGDPYMASTLLLWEQRFQHYHPEIKFENNLLGTDTAMGALYSGAADLALLGRESNQTEDDGFLHSLQYAALKLRLMNGSLDTPEKSPAPVFFVHRTNPLERLTLAQARRIFACEQPGQAAPAKTWGDLGLTGAWSARPIHVYTWDTRTGTGLFLIQAIQGPSKKLNWQIIHEFNSMRRPDGSTYDAAEQIMDALSHDPYGLASSTLRYADPQTKPLPLALQEGGPYVLPTPQTLVDKTYPLARSTYAFVDRPPGRALLLSLAEFLRFVLSEEAQALLQAQPGFLPLSSTDAAKQAHLLQ